MRRPIEDTPAAADIALIAIKLEQVPDGKRCLDVATPEGSASSTSFSDPTPWL